MLVNCHHLHHSGSQDIPTSSSLDSGDRLSNVYLFIFMLAQAIRMHHYSIFIIPDTFKNKYLFLFFFFLLKKKNSKIPYGFVKYVTFVLFHVKKRVNTKWVLVLLCYWPEEKENGKFQFSGKRWVVIGVPHLFCLVCELLKASSWSSSGLSISFCKMYHCLPCHCRYRNSTLFFCILLLP